jgi:hypothetical protein
VELERKQVEGIVEKMGGKIGCVSWEGNLYSETIIHIDYRQQT